MRLIDKAEDLFIQLGLICCGRTRGRDLLSLGSKEVLHVPTEMSLESGIEASTARHSSSTRSSAPTPNLQPRSTVGQAKTTKPEVRDFVLGRFRTRTSGSLYEPLITAPTLGFPAHSHAPTDNFVQWTIKEGKAQNHTTAPHSRSLSLSRLWFGSASSRS